MDMDTGCCRRGLPKEGATPSLGASLAGQEQRLPFHKYQARFSAPVSTVSPLLIHR